MNISDIAVLLLAAASVQSEKIPDDLINELSNVEEISGEVDTGHARTVINLLNNLLSSGQCSPEQFERAIHCLLASAIASGNEKLVQAILPNAPSRHIDASWSSQPGGKSLLVLALESNSSYILRIVLLSAKGNVPISSVARITLFPEKVLHDELIMDLCKVSEISVEDTGEALRVVQYAKFSLLDQQRCTSGQFGHIIHCILASAIVSGNQYLIKEMLEGRFIDATWPSHRQGKTLLALAVERSDQAIVKMILQHAEPYNYQDIKNLLMVPGLKPEIRSSLIAAQVLYEINAPEALPDQYLLREGQDAIEPLDPQFEFFSQGKNLLMAALEMGRADLVEVLIKKFNAKILSSNRAGTTSLEYIDSLIVTSGNFPKFSSCLKHVIEQLIKELLSLELLYYKEEPQQKESLEKLKKIAAVCRRLKSKEAKRELAEFFRKSIDSSFAKNFYAEAQIPCDFLDQNNSIRINEEKNRERLEKILLEDPIPLDKLETLVAEGIDLNFLSASASAPFHDMTPLSWAVANKHDDVVKILMKSKFINPHKVNRDGKTACYLAVDKGDIKSFSFMIQPAHVELPAVSEGYNELGSKRCFIQYPGIEHGYELSGPEAKEMYVAIQALKRYIEEEDYGKPQPLCFWHPLREDLTALLARLQKKYSHAHLLTNSQNTSPPGEEVYLVARHRTTRFIDDLLNNAQHEVQSAVMTVPGISIALFTIGYGVSIGPSIAYKGDMSKIMFAAKGDAFLERLQMEYGPKGLLPVKTDRENGWAILTGSKNNPRMRNVGEMKGRDGESHKRKLEQMQGRKEPFYESGQRKRLKINENRCLRRAEEQDVIMPYNEVVIETAVTEQRKNPKNPIPDLGRDIAHIVLSSHQAGGLSIGSLIIAVTTQIQLMLNEKVSRLTFPICYYNPMTGKHVKLSASSLALMTKLADLAVSLPLGVVDFNLLLKEALPKGTSLEAFFSNEHNAEEVKKFLLSLLPPAYHEDPKVIEVLEEGRTYSPEGDVTYVPYVGKSYCPVLAQAYHQKMCEQEELYKKSRKYYCQQKKGKEPNLFSNINEKDIVSAVAIGRVQEYKSFYKNPVLRHLPVLKPWVKYWERGDRDGGMPVDMLWHALTTHLINMPYEDDPSDAQVGDNAVIYRNNHDVTHAMRKRVGLVALMKVVKLYGKEEYKNAMNQYNQEELALFELNVFLERCGRTNELNGDEDASNGQRSAHIISEVAKDLGFKPDLVDSVCENSTNYDPSNPLKTKSFSGAKEDQRAVMADLIHELSMLNHRCDLWRCRSNGVKFVQESLLTVGKKTGWINNLIDPMHRNTAASLIMQIIDMLKKETKFLGDANFDENYRAECLRDPAKGMEEMLKKVDEIIPPPVISGNTIKK
ncbi:MAG: hypothetical protein A3F10_02990 [Coxiella sp. RIFCSPHIGHO2_12_FULL_42_15]|nr:MAG: hypothetical protein A3F10_02990 [Coxiella sp. RIFCSPHIGHO2_12_FULL_42_15]